MTIINADCIEAMNNMEPESIDAIVTDPPYGLGFMGKAWDDLPPGEEWARACLRVLKPGGHLLAFGGTRTWHRLAVAVEDAGFEIRDSIAWMYGSGFPKSLDVSKAVDKLDAADERRARALEFTAWVRSTGLTSSRINELTGTSMGGHYLTAAAQPAVATADLFDLLRPHLPEAPARIEELVRLRTVESENFKAREVTGTRTTGIGTGKGAVSYIADSENRDITAAHTPEAARWSGWGTALKPAFEPVVMARKPLVGTVAANVLAHGTGALNIDASRIGVDPNEPNIRTNESRGGQAASIGGNGIYGGGEIGRGAVLQHGRWPANVMLDEHAAEVLDGQTADMRAGKASTAHVRGLRVSGQVAGLAGAEPNYKAGTDGLRGFTDAMGGASRFFYVAKAPKSERPNVDGVAHPTVKPLALMRHLVRLVTPEGGTVLDPFAGSGTTVEAALLEGFDVIGIEREAEYLPLIELRRSRALGVPA